MLRRDEELSRGGFEAEVERVVLLLLFLEMGEDPVPDGGELRVKSFGVYLGHVLSCHELDD